MEHSHPVRRFVAYTVGIAVLLAGAWGAILLLPPTGPTNEADAMREVRELYAQIDSTLRPGEVRDRDDQKTADLCPLDGHGLQTTLKRDYRLNTLFDPEQWLDTLKSEFPVSADWLIDVTRIGNSDGRRIRLAGRSLLAIEMTLVGEGAQQRLRLSADTRCYPETTLGPVTDEPA